MGQDGNKSTTNHPQRKRQALCVLGAHLSSEGRRAFPCAALRRTEADSPPEARDDASELSSSTYLSKNEKAKHIFNHYL